MGPSVTVSEARDRARCDILIEGFLPLVYILADAHQLSGIVATATRRADRRRGQQEAIARFMTVPRRRTRYLAPDPFVLPTCPSALCASAIRQTASGALSPSGRESAEPIGQRALHSALDERDKAQGGQRVYSAREIGVQLHAARGVQRSSVRSERGL